MPDVSVPLAAALKEKEQEIQEQLDRIYKMIDEKKPTPLLKVEYKRAVDRMMEKLEILNASLEDRRAGMKPEDFDAQKNAIIEQFKEDIVVLAVAIDQATGVTE